MGLSLSQQNRLRKLVERITKDLVDEDFEIEKIVANVIFVHATEIELREICVHIADVWPEAFFIPTQTSPDTAQIRIRLNGTR